MRIYLDMCVLKRPFDDQTQARIALETDATLLICAAIDRGELAVVRSSAHDAENERNTDLERGRAVQERLDSWPAPVPLTEAVLTRGAMLRRLGFGELDALHLAWAELLAAEVFVTTDDRLISLATRLPAGTLKARVCDPASFVREHL